jgi:protease-4
VHSGENALLWSPTRELSPAERERFDAWLDRVYDDFTSKVADGRRIPKARVLEIARGRIWSGEDARQLGLVDELGGLETAARLARRAAGIPAGEDVSFETFPKPRSFFETVRRRDFGFGDPEDADADAALAPAIRTFRPLTRKLHALGLDRFGGGVLSMPPIGRE